MVPDRGSVKIRGAGSSCRGSAVTNLTSIHEDTGLIPGFTQWVKDLAFPSAEVQVADAARIPCCCGCGVGSSRSSDSIPSLGTSMCHGYGPKKKKKNVDESKSKDRYR